MLAAPGHTVTKRLISREQCPINLSKDGSSEERSRFLIPWMIHGQVWCTVAYLTYTIKANFTFPPFNVTHEGVQWSLTIGEVLPYRPPSTACVVRISMTSITAVADVVAAGKYPCCSFGHYVIAILLERERDFFPKKNLTNEQQWCLRAWFCLYIHLLVILTISIASQ